MKKISVIIPSYKPAEYLNKCLLSLENQTLSKKQYKVYISLNGPKDDYEKYILRLLSEMNFEYKYIYIKEAGVSNARNRLLDISTEEYIVFMDDDDLVSKNYLENLLSVSSMKYMGISNIYNFEKDICEKKENYIGKTFISLKDKEKSMYKIRKYFSSPWGKMIQRDMIQDIRFDTKLAKGEDSLFMAMISKNVMGIRKTSDDTCYYVYERVGSASRKKVKFLGELSTIFYLLKQYGKLLKSKDYEKVFVLTRIVATIRKTKDYFRLRD